MKQLSIINFFCIAIGRKEKREKKGKKKQKKREKWKKEGEKGKENKSKIVETNSIRPYRDDSFLLPRDDARNGKKKKLNSVILESHLGFGN